MLIAAILEELGCLDEKDKNDELSNDELDKDSSKNIGEKEGSEK